MNTHFSVRVAETEAQNPLIRVLKLRALADGPLPGFSAGAHVRVRVTLPDGAPDWRHYSLVNFSHAPDATDAPDHYTIAVRREDEGRGGSRFMHALRVGDELTIEPPKNDFPLDDLPGCSVLVAGGIGVTPLASMATWRRAHGRPVRMVYAGRATELMAFVPELRSVLGEDLRVHADADVGTPLDVAALLDGCGPRDQVYVCGPQIMLDAVLEAARQRGWAPERVRFELFTAAAAAPGDRPFEVVLAQSGQTVHIPADKTLLDCLIAHGCDLMFDCQRGECGVCAVNVIEGEIDHRDYVLNASERASGTVMQVCISRAKGPRLVLDL